ncbi:cell wall-binding repeat-containing protein [Leifsonia sp. NPDC080035]|uniref:Cell wall-binding repeat-containing protein n=1 Tax=Leifsonia sp. NPDC080035 TaxID=3143936 RepID=A0AAU7G997_9MICO
MGLRGKSRWGRALTTVLVSITAVAGGLVAVAPAAVADDGDRAAAYYASVAKATEGRVATPEQENANTAAALAGGLHSLAASDADPSKFVAGNLVSDAVFFNGSAWSQTTIQNFLNGKVATCKATTGPACLKTYTVATTTKPANAQCGAYTSPGVPENAASIVSKVAVACGINPVVLLVMMQKEQGLVTSSAPTQRMYDFATGWNCPDSTGCDSSTGSTGLFNQVYGAAWQFKRYGVSSSFNWYPVRAMSGILYSSTNASCGKKQVVIQNKATAALYYYTPYTPNAASLANYPGEGDGCSEYGIRNFWMMLNSWYGSSTAGSPALTSRISGSERFATAIAISQAAYPTPGTGIPVAFIANGLTFPDALAAAPAAAAMGGPLLLTTTTSVPANILTELTRLKPARIIVAGGVGVANDNVVKQLAAVNGGTPVERLSDTNREGTSRVIAARAFPTAPIAYVASSLDFPDALSAGAAKRPVILVNGATPDSGTLATLRALKVTTVKIAGGTGVVSASFEAGLKSAGFSVLRVSGADRYQTSLAVSKDAFPSATGTTLLASGSTFPDALAGAAYAGKAGAPLLVVRVGCVLPGAANLALRSASIRLLGGTGALGTTVGDLAVCP